MSPRELHSAPFILAILTLLSVGRASGQAASVAPAECPVELAFFQPPSLSEGPSAEAFWIAAPARLPLGSPTAQAPALVYSTDPAGGPAEEVVLERLFGAGDRLEGRYVRAASNRLQQSGEAAPGKDGLSDFRFEPNDPETEDCLENIDDCAPFDAVNAYYHVDRFATEFWRDRMGFDPPFQADVVTHISGDGAFADAPRDLIKLAAGWIFMRNAAKEDEIIYHEYTHLVAAALGFTLDINSGVEAQAVSEGYADYFAASYTNEPRIGEWVVTCPP
ncbi:MAG: hypothetical protein HKN29_00755, partial [Rhodothermales bacterium]|nr:hypothetical protein [Rhodothermales bacterium]